MKREFFRKIASTAICLTAIAVLTTSCSKDDDEAANHKLKFQLTGNYTGNLKATITYGDQQNADAETEDVSKLPWTKEVDVKGPYAMGIGVMTWDKSGKKGEKVNIKLYVDGVEVKSTSATADADGDVMSNIIQYTGGN